MKTILLTIVCLGAAAGVATFAGTASADDQRNRKGGSIRMVVTAFPDHLDPALSYTVDGWQPLWAVYTPLLTYKHVEGAEGAELVPGLAEALPDISADGKTYKLKLRAGLRYSDGSPVKASDFEHTIKRVLHLQSGGSPFYSKIVGAKKYLRSGKAHADLSGIKSDAATRQITIRLTAAEGSFSNILAMSFAGLVPGDTSFKNLDRMPPPGAGPYRIENLRLDRGYDLVKVTDFDVAGLPQGKLDRIAVVVIEDRARQVRETIQNKIDYMNAAPGPAQIEEVRQRFGGKRYREVVSNSTYYYFLSHRVAPFNKKAVRQAVSFAVDKRALVALFGGLLEPSCNFLPPGMKGYEKISPCPYGDPRGAPDLDRAKKMIQDAGVVGTRVTVYGSDEPESESLAGYMTGVLNQIGFKAKARIVKGSAYFTTIANNAKAQIGVANWFQDFPHPSNFMFLVDRKTIQNRNNQNFGFVDDELINSTLKRANKHANIDEVASQYAAADRRLLQEAHLIPYGHRKRTVFMSERMNFSDDCVVVHPVYNVDFTRLCLK